MTVLLCGAISLTGCARKSDEQRRSKSGKAVIQNTGSDTMVNLAQAWAEEYATVDSTVSVEVSGGGSGTGIAALINGTVDIANCSRKIEPDERKRAEENTGKTPDEFVVAYDALAVFVSKQNPLSEISLSQLAEIYGENGSITKWSQLGITGMKRDEIIVINRQSNSGTYHYFREAVLGKKRDFRLGTYDMHGSKDVVEVVARTPGAIGFSGMGYATHDVKMLRICVSEADSAFLPNIQNALSGKYPIARPLLMYTIGEPTPVIKNYLDWIFSKHGQKIVALNGYIPLTADAHLGNHFSEGR
ncbi:phosphate ABC transporter substrate-binding protein [Chloroherpeton thalassium]|nr:phosphate ABC transporter substrate-binding protein [Chloroherpeton thalassium]